MSPSLVCISVLLALFLPAVYSQWIVTVTYNNWECSDNSTGSIQSVYSVKNDSCLWLQKGQSGIWTANGGQITRITFTTINCTGMSSTANEAFTDGECVRSTGSPDPRSQKIYIAATYFVPAGNRNGKDQRTYSNQSMCISSAGGDDGLVVHRWFNFEAWLQVFNGTAVNPYFGDCFPRPLTSSLRVYDYTSCNSTHEIRATCSDSRCTDCTIEGAYPLSTNCISDPTYQFPGGAAMPTREACLAQGYNSARSFGYRSPTYRNFAKPSIPAGTSNIILQAHDFTCTNESSFGYLVMANDSCVSVIDGGGFFQPITPSYDPLKSYVNYMCNETGLYSRPCTLCPSFCDEWTIASSNDCLPYRGDATIRLSHRCIGTSDPWPAVNASSTFASYKDSTSCNALSSPTFFNGSVQYFAGKAVFSPSCTPVGKYFRTGFCNSTYAAALTCIDSECQKCFSEEASSLTFPSRPNCQSTAINSGLLYWGVPNAIFAFFSEPPRACSGNQILNVTRVPVPPELALQTTPASPPSSASAPVQPPSSSSPSTGSPVSSAPSTAQPNAGPNSPVASAPTAPTPATGSPQSSSGSNNSPSLAGAGSPTTSSVTPLTSGTIAGIIIAAFLAIIVIIIFCFLLLVPRCAGRNCCCCICCVCCVGRRRDKKKKKEETSVPAVQPVAMTSAAAAKDASSSDPSSSPSGSEASQSSQSEPGSDSESEPEEESSSTEDS